MEKNTIYLKDIRSNIEKMKSSKVTLIKRVAEDMEKKLKVFNIK